MASSTGPTILDQIGCRTSKQLINDGKVPLNGLDLKAYRDALLAERTQLANEDAASAEDRGTVTLDQQSVGRLSRMDALQRAAAREDAPAATQAKAS